VPSVATIWRVLSRRGFVVPQPQKRPRSSWRRFQADQPNECWQADTTHWALADGSDVEILNVLDDHSRLLVASRAFVTAKAADVVETFHLGASELGLPASMLTDIQTGCVLRIRVSAGRRHEALRGRCPSVVVADRSEHVLRDFLPVDHGTDGGNAGVVRPVENSVTGAPGPWIPVSECPARLLPVVGRNSGQSHDLGRELMQQLTLGVDVACRAAHQASLADPTGRLIWSGRRFRTTVEDLDRLWAGLPAGVEMTVVMEPTRNAWVPLAAWFRRHGARVILVPPEQSADLRDYYSKHAKSDRLDSQMLARLPLLHPEGLHPAESSGPADPLRRATKLRASLVKRRTAVLGRLDAYLELLGPGWHAAFGGDLANNTPLRFLAAGYADPLTLRRVGRGRLIKFFWRHSRGAWGADHVDRLLNVADETLVLWDADLDYGDLADDIAVEARLALQLTAEIHELEQRITVILHELDPGRIMTSVPGVAEVNGAQILARLGDPRRFRSLAGARSFSGLVPSLSASGLNGRHGPPTKAGDAPLREALFMAADQARRIDPTLAARYHRLMSHDGRHHNSALCHIATTLLTRIVACWRAGTPYVIRDLDGTALTTAQGRAIVTERYTISNEVRQQRRTTNPDRRTSRRTKESQSAPSTGPSKSHARRHDT
jgi:transposase